ncbi:MAG TPA: exonuclease domain-containing protein [Chitinophagaceae bacterium]|nr:exonuclease domain-containing protein [Chitinophagaceae bacterium]
MQYAIVDIETTGGWASGSGITEIAIVIHDGISVLERYQTLVNPGMPIPLAIQVMTGIDDDMVSGSPAFEEVAEQVIGLLSGRIFVAHNVNFDYSFIKHNLQMAGYDYSAPKLCTVRLSRKIRPGLASYSLGRLCSALEIPISNRHRAGGDADATAILLARLLSWDTEGHFERMLNKRSGEQQLPPNLPKQQFDALPRKPGVYYFLNRTGNVIYVGKAKDLHKRVASHFTGHNPNPQRQHFLKEIYSIHYELCGTELMAFLLEAVEIKRLWPPYNRAMKRYEPKFGLYTYEDQKGYLRLAIGRLGKYHPDMHVFYRQTDGADVLHRLARRFGLCAELCMLGDCHCDQRGASVPDGCTAACIRQRPPEVYNRLVQDALDYLDDNLATFAIVDEGRDDGELSCIWVERGNFYGMGYISHHGDLQSVEEVKGSLTPYGGNHYMMQLIKDYAERHPSKVRRFGV